MEQQERWCKGKSRGSSLRWQWNWALAFIWFEFWRDEGCKTGRSYRIVEVWDHTGKSKSCKVGLRSHCVELWRWSQSDIGDHRIPEMSGPWHQLPAKDSCRHREKPVRNTGYACCRWQLWSGGGSLTFGMLTISSDLAVRHRDVDGFASYFGPIITWPNSSILQ